MPSLDRAEASFPSLTQAPLKETGGPSFKAFAYLLPTMAMNSVLPASCLSSGPNSTPLLSLYSSQRNLIQFPTPLRIKVSLLTMACRSLPKLGPPDLSQPSTVIQLLCEPRNLHSTPGPLHAWHLRSATSLPSSVLAVQVLA